MLCVCDSHLAEGTLVDRFTAAIAAVHYLLTQPPDAPSGQFGSTRHPWRRAAALRRGRSGARRKERRRLHGVRLARSLCWDEVIPPRLNFDPSSSIEVTPDADPGNERRGPISERSRRGRRCVRRHEYRVPRTGLMPGPRRGCAPAGRHWNERGLGGIADAARRVASPSAGTPLSFRLRKHCCCAVGCRALSVERSGPARKRPAGKWGKQR